MARDSLRPRRARAPNRRDAHEIVEAILVAATDLASPEVTTNQIAARAGVGIASLYRYFPDRGAIFAELSRRLHRRFVVQMRAILAQPGLTVEEAVRAICKAAVSGPGVSRELRRCLNLLVPPSWSAESADETYAETVLETASWVSAKVATPPADLAERMFAAISVVRGIVAMAMLYPQWAPPDERLIELASAGVLAVLGDELTSR